MFHVPRYFIFVFVGLSILTAYGVHRWTREPTAGMADLSSAGFESFITEAIFKAGKVKSGTHTEQVKCDCTSVSQSASDTSFEYEDLASCSASRKEYEEAFKEIALLFRGERVRLTAEFPRACVLYILNNTMGRGGGERRDLATCKSSMSDPVRGGFKSCITTTFVNTVYHSFSDVAECMDLPQRDFLPKIFNESGFHPNAFGIGMDAGVGQLTRPSIAEANKKFQSYKDQAMTSGKESCQRLAPLLKGLGPASVSPRCNLIKAPANPLLNIFYMAIVYHQNRKFVDGAIDDLKIIDRMTALGLPPSQYERAQLNQILTTLGYNSGARTAVVLFSSYLRKLENSKRKLTLQDLDFRIGIEPVKGTEKNERPTSSRKLSSSRKTPWNFPGYLALNQNTGTAGYLTVVRSYADQLNQVFKEGVCVPNSYLAL